MSLLSLIAALLLEQLHPLALRKNLSAALGGYTQFFLQHFNAGEQRHGKIAWLLAVLLPLLATVVTYWALHYISLMLAWAFNVLVLYLTMGFRQFSHYFTDIHRALRDGELEEARRLLAAWRGMHAHELNEEEVARLSIEQALLASHYHVFGVIAWFVFTMLIGLGPAGAVLYRLAHSLSARWGSQGEAEFGLFGKFALNAHRMMEWLPLRMVAATFAIVGNFEDTVYCWRTQAGNWPEPEAGLILASGAGALGVRLGGLVSQEGLPLDRPELGVGDEADADFMQSTVGLVWRALVFWMLLLSLLTFATLTGAW